MTVRKVLMLNSGGFDSVVLAHYLREELGDEAEIHSMHFNYGQNSQDQEMRTSRKLCRDLNLQSQEVALSRMMWTKSRFFEPDYKDTESQYLEWRNLIFMSYAFSYAESMGIDTIYLAVLTSHFYKDTSKDFIGAMNSLPGDIEVVAPFSELEKWELFYYARKYKIGRDDYFTCDTPKNDAPCGECNDCKLLAEYHEEYAETTSAVSALIFDGIEPNNALFSEIIASNPIEELRVLINNDCQLKCEHCFYGFDEPVNDLLTPTEMTECIKQCIDLGVKNIHFSGKEPLFNGLIFQYARWITEYAPNVTFDVVTNGINVPKYAQTLKDLGFSKVFLSIDDLLVNEGLRKVHDVTEKALIALNELEIPVEVFIDLHSGNYSCVHNIIEYLTEFYQVKDFYVRTIIPVGRAKDFLPLTVPQLNEVFEQLLEVVNARVFLAVNCSNTFRVANSKADCAIKRALNNYIDTGYGVINSNFEFYPEIYCCRYDNQITITPDGYVLGCGSEVCHSDYDKISAGNVTEFDLKTLVQKGKQLNIEGNKSFPVDKCGLFLKKCPHLGETT